MKKKNTFENEWNEWRKMHRTLTVLLQQQIHAGASYSLSREMAGSGCGISSSDVNHSMFNIWKSVNKDKQAYIDEGINLYSQRLGEAIRW